MEVAVPFSERHIYSIVLILNVLGDRLRTFGHLQVLWNALGFSRESH